MRDDVPAHTADPAPTPDPAPTSDSAPAARSGLHPVASVAIGVAAALVGLLPWLVTGGRLPLQNLWATETLPDDMPFSLLPFSQYAISLLLGMIVVGFAIDGIVARALRERLPRRGVLLMAAGTVAVLLTATVQSTIVVERGLADRTASTLYLVAILAVILVALLLGALVLRLIARASVPWASIGLGLAALATSLWLSGLLAPLGSLPGPVQHWLLSNAHRWVAPVLVGVAIGWAGIRSPGRIAAALGNLLLLWIIPAGITAVSAAAGSRVLLPHPAEMLDFALGVFRSALLMPELVVPPLLVAVVVAAVVVAVRLLLDRRYGAPGEEFTPQTQASTPHG